MTPEDISQEFRRARLNATALTAYPGAEVPASLSAAYAIQDLSIAAWADPVAGYKVAAVQPTWRETYPAERLGGPVFQKSLAIANSGKVELPVIRDGYAAVEAEFALLLAPGFPTDTKFDSVEQLQPFVAAVHAAIELAGSPLHNLSALGPGAVISDFGNNTGLAVGPALEGFFDRAPSAWPSETRVNGALVGEGSADRIPGGPLAALLFLANHMVERGATLRPGQWVSTGASTGIHPVRPGDEVEVNFDGKPALSLRITQAVPLA